MRKEGVEPSRPKWAHGSEPCAYTVSPLALVRWAGLEPARPRLGTAGLQPAAIAAMRPTLETPEGFEPSITGLRPVALGQLGYGVWQTWWESNPHFRVWSPVGAYHTHALVAQEGVEPS